MPTYAYACTACGHRFEVQQSFSDAALTECPECEGRLRKLFNSVGIVFKGSGFYRTDSRSASPAASGAGSSDGGSTWESVPSPTRHPLERLAFVAGARGWAVGFGGTIIAYAPANVAPPTLKN